MKIKRLTGTGSYSVFINNVLKYEIYNGSNDMGYSYWQISSIENGLLNSFDATDSFKDAKQMILEIENFNQTEGK